MKKALLLATVLFFALPGSSQLVLLPVNGSNSESDPTSFVNMGGFTYFIATKSGPGYELFRSNGTSAGTTLVKDIRPGNASSLVSYSALCVFKNNLYFFANDGTHGVELWKSDGTDTGTVMVKDIYPGTSSSNTTLILTANDSALFFFAEDTALASRYGLWTSDGTTTGTSFLKTLTSAYSEIFPDSNLVYFDASSGATGDELWVSDGTIAGTQLVKDIYLTGQSQPHNFAKFGNGIVFSANSGNGIEPFMSDGTGPGTVQIKDINAYGNSAPFGFAEINGKVIFYANDSTHGIEPWVTDGTSGGTQLLIDNNPGPTSSISVSYNQIFFPLNGLAYFAASGKLMRSDGTIAGTNQFMTSYSAGLSTYAQLNGRLYFIATPPTTLWSTNGTDSILHSSIGMGLHPSSFKMFAGNNLLYFVRDNGTFGGKQLYKVDLGICFPQPLIQGNTTLTCNQHGTTLSLGTYDHYIWSTGDTTAQINVSTGGVYAVTVSNDAVACISADSVLVVVNSSSATLTMPQICGVTVDSATGLNQIVWNKNNPAISETFFRLERETGVNQFALAADIPYDSLSAYLDTSSNPMVTSSRYRLSLLDSCGNHSNSGTVHETVHLSQNVGINGEVNLIWNKYIGTSYAQLNVWRSVNGGAWVNLSVVSGNAVSYTDLTPPSGTLNYQIEVLIDSTCTPSRSSFTLFSNRVSVIATGIEQITTAGLSLSPNPVSSVLQIRLTENILSGNLIITDITGRTVREIPVNKLNLSVNVSELAKGMYFIRHSADMVRPAHFLKQ